MLPWKLPVDNVGGPVVDAHATVTFGVNWLEPTLELRFPSTALFCLLASACGRDATEPARTTAAPAPETQTFSNVTALPLSGRASETAQAATKLSHEQQLTQIREVFQKLQGDRSLTAAAFDAECDTNETRFRGRSFVRDGTVQKASIVISPPGDTTVEYDFYYDRGALAFALYRVDGYAGEFTHRIEYRYYFVAGEPIECLRKEAKGSAAEVAAALPNARNRRVDDCRFTSETLELAGAFEPGGSVGKLTKLACRL